MTKRIQITVTDSITGRLDRLFEAAKADGQTKGDFYVDVVLAGLDALEGSDSNDQ